VNTFTPEKRSEIAILELTRRKNDVELVGAGPLLSLFASLLGHRTTEDTGTSQPSRERRLIDPDFLAEGARGFRVRPQHPLNHLGSKSFGIEQNCSFSPPTIGTGFAKKKAKKAKELWKT
jgi:hypothetical protein